MITFGIWDLVLLVVVSLHATVVAYLSDARAKAALLALPLPFTFATLAVGAQVNVSHVMGLIALLLFTHAVRVLHQSMRWPIVLAIVMAAGIYITLGWLAERWIPKSALMFWLICGVNLLLAGALHFSHVHHDEPPYRSSLPLWVKLPIIMAVVIGLMTIKKFLGGFATTFPMVGVIAAYETRRTLRTTCQGIPLTMLMLTPMMMACRLAQPSLGLYGGLAVAWIVLALLAPLLLRGYLNRSAVASGEQELQRV